MDRTRNRVDMGMRGEEVQHDPPVSGVVPFIKSEKRLKLIGQDRNQIWTNLCQTKCFHL